MWSVRRGVPLSTEELSLLSSSVSMWNDTKWWKKWNLREFRGRASPTGRRLDGNLRSSHGEETQGDSKGRNVLNSGVTVTDGQQGPLPSPESRPRRGTRTG